jgi:hypothetical protein
MSDPTLPVPRLDFGDWYLAFPDRGNHVFLPASDLRKTVAQESTTTEAGLWLMRAESGVAVILPGSVSLVREGLPVIGVAVLHQGDRVEVAGQTATFQEVQYTKLGQGNRLVGRKCQHCHVPHEEGESPVRCPLCGEGYHHDCWLELSGKRCATRNCPFSPGEVDGLQAGSAVEPATEGAES